MIINITGYGSTGASAYVDLLKEFSGIQFLPDSMEFQLLQEPDGILDLEYALTNGCRTNIQVAISRFIKNAVDRSIRLDIVTNGRYKELKKEYISNIANICWKGKSIYDPVDMRKWYENGIFRKINRFIDRYVVRINKYNAWPLETKRYISSISCEDFVGLTRSYLREILIACGFDLKKNIILEQLFNACTPLKGNHLLPNDSISIIVDRDPRDVYFITNYIFPYYNRYMPHSRDVDAFIAYYKATHRNIAQYINEPGVYYVKYEDTIYQYDKTIYKLESILQGSFHKNKKAYFMPENSINNTQLFRKDYSNHLNEIIKIEKELKEYLYPFDEYSVDYEVKNQKPFERQSDLK